MSLATEPIARLAAEVAAFTATRSGGPDFETGLEGLLAVASPRPTPFERRLYEPSLCLILQGTKEVQIGDYALEMRPGDAVIISHHLPVAAKIERACEQQPFLSMALELDLDLVHELRRQVGEAERGDALERGQASPPSLVRGPADPALVEALSRLFALAPRFGPQRPSDLAVLEPLVRREIHYHLLVAPHGRALRQLMHRRSHASQIARAVAALRRDFAHTLTVAELARAAGMSESSFHEHFKALTATTPLQYQKCLRLLEARRLLTGGGRNVTETALAVGYQSPSQFSREYSRHFGHAPSHDRPPA